MKESKPYPGEEDDGGARQEGGAPGERTVGEEETPLTGGSLPRGVLTEEFDRLRQEYEGPGADLGINQAMNAVSGLLRALKSVSVDGVRLDEVARRQLGDVLEALVVTVQGTLDAGRDVGVLRDMPQGGADSGSRAADTQGGGWKSGVSSFWKSARVGGAAKGSHSSRQAGTAGDAPWNDVSERLLDTASEALVHVERALAQTRPAQVRDRRWSEDKPLMEVAHLLVTAEHRGNPDHAWAAIERLRMELTSRGIEVVAYDGRREPEDQDDLFSVRGDAHGEDCVYEMAHPALAVRTEDGAKRVLERGYVHRTSAVRLAGAPEQHDSATRTMGDESHGG